MSEFTSELFRFLTPASPGSVWEELTTTGEPVAHLYGLTVETDWRPHSPLTVGPPGGPALTGQILHVKPPCLLAYSLGDEPGTLSVYLTWQLEPTPAGTIVRLYVDETGPTTGPSPELIWMPVLEALRSRLASREHES